MVALLLGLIVCILLFGPFGLGVFVGIMIYILPIYLIFYFVKIIVDHNRKHPQRDRVVTKAKRGKTTVLYRDGKWMDNQKPRRF